MEPAEEASAVVSRVVEVAHVRLSRWLTGFAERHGPIAVDGPWIRGEDGARARISSWPPLDGAGQGGSKRSTIRAATSVEELVEAAQPPARLALLLVRRGGYAVGIAKGAEIVERKVGRRHVQSRTAAGGWSQQRFARRRANQADELVDAVRGHAARVLLGAAAEGLVLGGDRRLAAAVLEDVRLAPLRDLPIRELYDLPDPTSAVLTQALARARAVRIELDEEA